MFSKYFVTCLLRGRSEHGGDEHLKKTRGKFQDIRLVFDRGGESLQRSLSAGLLAGSSIKSLAEMWDGEI